MFLAPVESEQSLSVTNVQHFSLQRISFALLAPESNERPKQVF